MRELMFEKIGLKLLNQYRYTWKMLKYYMKPTWSQIYGATQIKVYPGRIGNKLWANLLSCVQDYQWRSLNLGLDMSIRAILIMRNRMKKIPSHLIFVLVEKNTVAECFITIFTDTSVVTSSCHLDNSCTDMHTQGMRSVCVCVRVCGARRWCCSSLTRPFVLDEPQSCPQEKGSRSPRLKRASQAWPLIMYSPSPYNWKGPWGHQAPAIEKKKNTQTTFAFDLIILHGWYMVLRASVWGPFRKAVSLTTSAPTLVTRRRDSARSASGEHS